jgi:hypothetical protein
MAQSPPVILYIRPAKVPLRHVIAQPAGDEKRLYHD